MTSVHLNKDSVSIFQVTGTVSSLQHPIGTPEEDEAEEAESENDGYPGEHLLDTVHTVP